MSGGTTMTNLSSEAIVLTKTSVKVREYEMSVCLDSKRIARENWTYLFRLGPTS